jgi:hypothetical protein
VPEDIMGVPTHALIVHATVVLLPLAALCAVAIALVPALRRRYGLPVGLLTVVAVASVPLAQNSGEKLFDLRSSQFGPGDTTEAGLMEQHADLAHGLLKYTIVLLVGVLIVLAVPALARRRAGERVLVGSGGAEAATEAPAQPAWAKAGALLGILVTLAGAVLTVVMVVRIGHLGSEAAWTEANPSAQGMAR